MTEFIVDYRGFILLIHIFGTTLGLGGAIVTDLLFMRFLKDFKVSHEEKEVLDTLSMVIWIGLAILVLSGFALFWPYKLYLLSNPLFQTKMAVVAIVLLNGLVLNFYIAPKLTSMVFNDPALNAPAVNRARKLSPIFGGISIISWAYAFFLGAMSSDLDYPFHVLFGAYLILLIIGISSSFYITKYKFRKVN